MHNANNERVKRRYFVFLKEAKKQNDSSVDAAAKALNRFEQDTGFRDFKTFHHEQAVAFKRRLATQQSQKTGRPLSKATLYATLAHLKRFFQWLSEQPGYRSRIGYADAEYFNLSGKETRIATARRERPTPTIEQLRHILFSMPATTEIERRNRAVVAFILLTGARDGAIASMKLKHVDLASRSICQDAREVRTKFSKTFTTTFFPVGSDVSPLLEDWVHHLRETKLWGNEDPLFPATAVSQGESHQFEATGFRRDHWRSAARIRGIFRTACVAADLPAFHPHSVRHALTRLGQTLCRTPEEMKAWSQNLGHEGVLTTFRSYGGVAPDRQAEIIRGLGKVRPRDTGIDAEELARFLARELEKRVS